MKGDFSKNTFRKEEHFLEVDLQQGRVLLDADWNEQANIITHQIRTRTEDIIGNDGAPFHYAGFEIITVDAAGNKSVTGTNIKISEGRFYVDGILCENESAVLFAAQPDFNESLLPTKPGRYIFYLDVWLRHITVLEDPALREVALGGPDTTTRTKIIWQVKTVMQTGANCKDLLPAEITDPSTGKLHARSEKPTGTDSPCGLITSGGYRRLENQLYRVEIHKAGIDRAHSTFKWSRDNGFVLVKWISKDTADPNKLQVSSAGRDELLGFKSGDWIELIDDRTDLLGLPGVLVQLAKVDGDLFTINPATINDPENPGATTVTLSTKNPRIRRWDSVGGEIKLNTNNSIWLLLEDGVEVNFKEGTFKTGDYWLIPARTAIADIEWPFTDHQSPKGIKHHFAKLAIVDLSSGGVITTGSGTTRGLDVLTPIGEVPISGDQPIPTFDSSGSTLPDPILGVPRPTPRPSPITSKIVWTKLSDCRPIFPPVTELTALYYVSGDGQEAMPGKQLPMELMVGVSNGQWPVENARVKFELLAFSRNPIVGSLSYVDTSGSIQNGPGGITYTDINGIAKCKWTIGPAGSSTSQQVKATLLDAADQPMHLPVIFTANQSIASEVFYDGSECANWPAPTPVTVAEALTALCKRESSKGCSVTVGHEGQYKTLKEAFDKLKDEKDICICLLPSGKGEHIAKDLIVKDKNFIEINGCGAKIRLLDDDFRMMASKIIIRGIDFRKAVAIRSVMRFEVDELDLEYCTFEVENGLQSPTRDALSVSITVSSINDETGSAIVRWANNSMSSEYSLDLFMGVHGWILDNKIEGGILLQYSSKFIRLDWKQIDDGTRKEVQSKLFRNLAIDSRNEFLCIRGNTIRSINTNNNTGAVIPIDLNSDKTVKLRGYKNLIVSENIFVGNTNSFLAELINFNNNQFPNAVHKTIVAFALGQQGVVMGNIDPLYNNDSSAIIDTIFSNLKIIAPNLIIVK